MSGAIRYVFNVGDVYGRLTVKEDLLNGQCVCVCSCGTEKVFNKTNLKSGKVVSCGCWNKEKAKKHGMEGTLVYTTWAQMLSRCRNTNNKYYKDYGGRGITVCDRWLDFKNFYSDMGDKPLKMSLDRIDNNGNYTPENCRWISQKEQIRNRRVSPRFEWQGEVKSLAELAEQYGLPWRRVYERMRKGWDIEKALLTAIGPTGSKK